MKQALRLHAQINGMQPTPHVSSFEKLCETFLGHFDLIIDADICF
jgi:hypothetical protein